MQRLAAVSALDPSPNPSSRAAHSLQATRCHHPLSTLRAIGVPSTRNFISSIARPSGALASISGLQSRTPPVSAVKMLVVHPTADPSLRQSAKRCVSLDPLHAIVALIACWVVARLGTNLIDRGSYYKSATNKLRDASNIFRDARKSNFISIFLRRMLETA
jgi:hypothetical protein